MLLDYMVPKIRATDPTDERWWQRFLGRPTASAVDVTDDTALTYSACWAATRILAGTGSWLPLKVYQSVSRAGGEGREHLRTHPVQRLLKRPNGNMNGMQLRLLMWRWQINSGNAYAEIVWSRNEPLALLPISPDRVQPDYEDDGSVVYRVRRPDGSEGRIDAENMLHVPSVLSVDGVTGMGVIEYARESVGFGLATERHGAHFFGHGAIPPVIIEHPGKLMGDTERGAFRKEWRDVYGSATGEKVGLIGGGATAKLLQISQEDSQFLETRQHNIEEIARWYGVPPHMLQHLLRATFNNIEHLGIDFVVYSLIQWMSIWEEQIESKLLSPAEALDDGIFVEHNVNALLRGDSQTRAMFYQTMVQSGLMSRNEIRRLENLDPVAGGDTFIVQGAMVPLGDDGKPESDFAGTVGGDGGAPPADRQARSSAAAKTCIVQALSRMLAKETDRANRASHKAETFIDWLDSFYGEHASEVESSVQPLFDMIGEQNAADFARRWCESGRESLLELSGSATPAELRESVASFVRSPKWTNRPAEAVFQLEAA